MYRCARATAWWADRPGRKPKLCSENVGSHRSWRTCSRACWISLSTTHGTPSFLTPPSGLGISTLDRLRLVGSREQLRPDVWPVLTQVGLGALDDHPIDARATFVTANSFPRSYEISSVAHLRHQLFCAGRAFGCGLRHGWFGPLVSAARGFTPAFWDQGQRVLDLLPRSTHELPVLLAALNRSGLWSSFPA